MKDAGHLGLYGVGDASLNAGDVGFRFKFSGGENHNTIVRQEDSVRGGTRRDN